MNGAAMASFQAAAEVGDQPSEWDHIDAWVDGDPEREKYAREYLKKRRKRSSPTVSSVESASEQPRADQGPDTTPEPVKGRS